jgi:hypothetical protein
MGGGSNYPARPMSACRPVIACGSRHPAGADGVARGAASSALVEARADALCSAGLWIAADTPQAAPFFAVDNACHYKRTLIAS